MKLLPKHIARFASLVAALSATAPACAQQDDVVPERNRWWQSFSGNVLVPLGDWDVYRKDGLRIDNDQLRTRLKLNARVYGDVGHLGLNEPLLSAFAQDAGWDTAITQARLTLLGWVFDTGMFKLQLEFADRVQVKDSWFRFNPLPYVGLITLGNMKEPFSLDDQGSSANQTFMANALPVLAFAPGRNIGFMAHNTAFDGHLTWAVGGFWNTSSYSDLAGAKDAFSNAIGFDVTGRITWLPVYEDDGRDLTHLGLSLSLQSLTGPIQVRAAPETALVDNYFADTGLFSPDKGVLAALEFARVIGPWSFQGEAMLGDYRSPALGRQRLSGGYAFVSHLLTGEHRLYDRSTGTFDGVIPRHDFSSADGSWGAFEVALRLSTLDLDSQDVSGGRQRDLTAGLNWYLNPSTRVMFNVVHVLLNGRGNPPAVDGGRANIVQARLQYTF